MKKQAKKTAKRGRPAKKTLTIDESPCSIDNLIEQQFDEKFLVVRSCSNPNWVIVRMDGQPIPVKCPNRLSNKLLGKTIKIRLVSSDPEDYYEYVS